MDAANYNKRIVIQSRTKEIKNGRLVLTDWQNYYLCWCRVLDLIGKEKYDAFNSKLENSLKFKCRLCRLLKDMYKDIREKNGKEYQIIFEEVAYNIVFVDTLGGSNTEIILQCKVVS